jgi:hypothetical protein
MDGGYSLYYMKEEGTSIARMAVIHFMAIVEEMLVQYCH